MYAASATSAAKATVIEASSAIDVAQAYGFGKGTMDMMRFVFNRDPIFPLTSRVRSPFPALVFRSLAPPPSCRFR